MTNANKLDGLMLTSSTIRGVSPQQIGDRYEYLREGILAANGAIDNEAPDLALRKLMEMANLVRAWGC